MVALSHDPAAATEAIDGFQRFLSQASRYPLLTREEEVDLARRIERGDLAAKERLINSNLRLVIKFARPYQGNGLSMEDLVQEGMLGLIRAAEKFDHQRDYKFSTYAVSWIKRAIQRGLDNTSRPVRIPARIAQRERTVNRVETELTASLKRKPTEEEIAERAELRLGEVKALRNLTLVTASLDAPSLDECVGEEGGISLHEMVPAKFDDAGDLDALAAKRRELIDAEQAVERHKGQCKRTGTCWCLCGLPVDGPRARYAGSTHSEREVHRSNFNRKVVKYHAEYLDPLRDEVARREAGVALDEFEYELRSNRGNSNDIPSSSNGTPGGWRVVSIHSKPRAFAVGAKGRRERTAASIGSWLATRDGTEK
jgi:RNA polymerase sigma factor (sigma-70 family)